MRRGSVVVVIVGPGILGPWSLCVYDRVVPARKRIHSNEFIMRGNVVLKSGPVAVRATLSASCDFQLCVHVLRMTYDCCRARCVCFF